MRASAEELTSSDGSDFAFLEVLVFASLHVPPPSVSHETLSRSTEPLEYSSLAPEGEPALIAVLVTSEFGRAERPLALALGKRAPEGRCSKVDVRSETLSEEAGGRRGES